MIRKYEPTDKEQLRTLIQANTPKDFHKDEEIEFMEYLDQGLEDYFVVVEDEMIIGCGGINYEPEIKQAVISWDMIHPEHHGKGVGRLLMEHRLEVINAKTEYEVIRVRTSQHAHGFYAKMGFKLFDQQKDYWALGFDLYDMKQVNRRSS